MDIETKPLTEDNQIVQGIEIADRPKANYKKIFPFIVFSLIAISGTLVLFFTNSNQHTTQQTKAKVPSNLQYQNLLRLNLIKDGMGAWFQPDEFTKTGDSGQTLVDEKLQLINQYHQPGDYYYLHIFDNKNGKIDKIARETPSDAELMLTCSSIKTCQDMVLPMYQALAADVKAKIKWLAYDLENWEYSAPDYNDPIGSTQTLKTLASQNELKLMFVGSISLKNTPAGIEQTKQIAQISDGWFMQAQYFMNKDVFPLNATANETEKAAFLRYFNIFYNAVKTGNSNIPVIAQMRLQRYDTTSTPFHWKLNEHELQTKEELYYDYYLPIKDKLNAVVVFDTLDDVIPDVNQHRSKIFKHFLYQRKGLIPSPTPANIHCHTITDCPYAPICKKTSGCNCPPTKPNCNTTYEKVCILANLANGTICKLGNVNGICQNGECVFPAPTDLPIPTVTPIKEITPSPIATATPAIGNSFKLTYESGTIERNVDKVYVNSWYFGGNQLVKIPTGYTGIINKVELQVYHSGNTKLTAMISEKSSSSINLNQKESKVSVLGNKTEWVSFSFNYAVTENKEYILWLKKDNDSQVGWLTFPGSPTSTVKNYRITIQP